MRKSYTSILFSIFLGLLLPLVTAIGLLLPSPVGAEYPSTFSPQDAKPEMKPDYKGNLETLAKNFPFLLKDEDGKPITAEFVKYDLAGYDFSNADLSGSMFSVANLRNANLNGANLDNVIAYQSHFENADLANSTFRNADLLKSFFNGANIDGADFTEANLDQSQQRALCERATGKNSKTGADTFDSLECSSVSDRYVPAV